MSLTRKIILTFLSTVLFLSLFVISPSAENITGYVIDGEGYFSYDEAETIEKAAAEAYESTGVRYFVVTATRPYDNSVMPAVCGMNRSDSFCVLLIWNTDRYNLYTYGTAEKRISEDEVNDLLDASDVYPELKGGRYLNGSLAYIRHASDAVRINYGLIVLVAVIIGIVAGGVTTGIIIARYKMKIKPTNYPLDKYAKMNLNGQEDSFIGKHVAVVITSSGGGNSRGGGSGGHVSGGGNRGGR